MKLVRRWYEAVVAMLNLRAAELTTGVALVEAVAADEFDVALRGLTWREDEREDIRRGALLMAQAGITSHELAEAITAYVRNLPPTK